MDNYCHLFLLILTSVVCDQHEKVLKNKIYNKNCQLDFVNVIDNLRKAEQNLKTFRILETKSDLKIRWVLPKNLTEKRRLRKTEERLTSFKVHLTLEHSNVTKTISKTLRKLKTLENWLKVETLVFYDFSESFNSLEIRNINFLPALMIKDALNWRLRNVFNSNFLSVVLLGPKYPSKHQLLYILKQTLKGGVHLNKIIFLKETSIKANDTDALHLLNWLHVNGFWQSLLMDCEGNYLSLQHFTKTLIRNLTIEDFLRQTTNWRNLHGFPINCSIANNPPRAYIDYDNKQRVILKGYFGTIIKLFAQHYNATLNPLILSDLNTYTELDCVKYINDSQVDICGDALTTHDQYVISDPDEIAASYLMVAYDKPLPRFYYFLKPFQLNAWTLVIGSFFYKIIMLSLIHRLQHGFWNGSLQMLYASLSVLYLPFQMIRIKGCYRRFLEIIMILVGFVVANWYLSVLSSLLFTRLYFHDVNTLQHLVDHNISIMVDEFEQYLLNATENDPIIMQQLKVVSQDILLQHRGNLDPHYAYYSQYDKLDFYLHQQKFLIRPRMKILKGIRPINAVLGGIPMSPNWPFQHLLNDFIRRILNSGLYQRIYNKAMEEGISSGYLHYFPTEHHQVEPLSIEYFQMPAMLLAAGYSLAFFGFLFELMVFRGN